MLKQTKKFNGNCWYVFKFGCVEVAQGLVNILSLGRLCPSWTLEYSFRYAHRTARKALTSDHSDH